MEWTKSQRQAVEIRDKNILVSAAAGSGKTAVLVERIKQLVIQDGIGIDEMLIVTFTNAAAAEMKERIAGAISKEIEKGGKNEAFLRNQMNLINKSNISTFHSFCMEIIRRYFYFIDMEPNFKICDEAQKVILQMESLEALLDSEFEKNTASFISFVDSYASNKSEEEIKNMILYTHNFIQSIPNPFEWLKDAVAGMSLNKESFKETKAYSVMMEEIKNEINRAVTNFKKAYDIAAEMGISYAPKIMMDVEVVSGARGLLEVGFDPFVDGIKALEYQTLRSKKDEEIDEDIKEAIDTLRKNGKEIIKYIKNTFGKKCLDEYLNEINSAYGQGLCLYELVSEFDQLYHYKKNEKGLIDFNDLEHYALRILENKEVCDEYRTKFKCIFIDEYQDSNIVQETLINRIKRDNNVFMVGDVKQSIYGFRLADPNIFIEKYQQFKLNENKYNMKIDLNKNFRSKENILHSSNRLFKQIMNESTCAMDYDEDAFLYKGVSYSGELDHRAELNLVDEMQIDEIDLDDEIKEMKRIEMEASIAAQIIKETIGMKIYDDKLAAERTVSFKDIVILFRSLKDSINIYYEVLMSEGIPCYMDAGDGYFDTVEISLFLNLLRLIDNKKQDIPLLSIMRSPVFSFTTEEMIEIRNFSKERSYYEAFEGYSEKGTDEMLKNKCRGFIEKVDAWKQHASYMTLEEFLWDLLKETGYYEYISALPGGLQRQANLRMLIDKAGAFQNTSMKGLFSFINYIEQVKKSGTGISAVKLLGENDDVVRMMSTHKSKGLEFPVVVLAGLGKRFNRSNKSSKVILDRELGIGMRYVNPELSSYTNTLMQDIIKRKQYKEATAEEMRILYVAFTRAKDKLILLGTQSDCHKKIREACLKSECDIIDASCFLDWIIPAFIRGRKQIAQSLIGASRLDKPGTKKGTGSREQGETFLLTEEAAALLGGLAWFEVKIHDRSSINFLKNKKSDNKEIIKKGFKSGFEMTSEDTLKKTEIISNRLAWNYAFLDASKLPSKFSVSEIKQLMDHRHEESGLPVLNVRPQFLDDLKQYTAAEKGTLMHRVLQYIDPADTDTNEAIQRQIDDLVRKEILVKEESLIIQTEKIKAFFLSEIGSRIKNAEQVYREISFNIIKKAQEIIPNLLDGESEIIIQGTIDCYFKEKDRYILLDYKTDFLSNEYEIENIVERYSIQLKLYKEALETIKGIKIDEVYLYLFSIGKAIRVR